LSIAALEKKLEKIKIKFKIDSLGDDDEEEDDSSGTDEDDDGRREKARESGDDGEKAVLQLQIQRLTDALMKLKDLSVMEKKESEKKIRQLERENDSIPVLEEKIVKLKDDVKKANEKIEQLKEQLDVALEAEDMVEELSDKKLELEEVTHLVPCPIVSSLLLDRTQTHTMDLWISLRSAASARAAADCGRPGAAPAGQRGARGEPRRGGEAAQDRAVYAAFPFPFPAALQ
jgi:DNA repair exonuclease SbcCD ATPase subunit